MKKRYACLAKKNQSNRSCMGRKSRSKSKTQKFPTFGSNPFVKLSATSSVRTKTPPIDNAGISSMEESTREQVSERTPALVYGGQFCHLKRALHPTRDVVCTEDTRCQSTTDISTSTIEYSYISSAREVKRSQQHDRAECILRRLLTQKETTILEKSASILQLCIGDKINPTVFRLVNHESILLATKEHRLALSHLRDAEEALGGWSLESRSLQTYKQAVLLAMLFPIFSMTAWCSPQSMKSK